MIHDPLLFISSTSEFPVKGTCTDLYIFVCFFAHYLSLNEVHKLVSIRCYTDPITLLQDMLNIHVPVDI